MMHTPEHSESPQENGNNIEVRFVGPGIEPKKVPLRAVTDVLSAIQDLASWRDPFETSKVAQEKGITLVDVRKGSAVYDCVANCPNEAAQNFEKVSVFLADPDADSLSDEIGTVLPPLKSLSHVARLLNCRVTVHLPALRKEPLFEVDSGIYERITERAFVTGETTIVGEVMRAGGATEMRCVLRVVGRSRLLYCDVTDASLARRLGQSLYQPIVASGKARWLSRTWRLLHFEISDFTQPELGDVDDAISELRSAGLGHWNDESNPEAIIKGASE